MAFDIQNFEMVNGANLDATRYCNYKELTATLAAIGASGYFNELITRLAVKDLIWIVGSDGGHFVEVTSVTTNVTVAAAVSVGEIPLPQGNVLVGNASGVSAANDLSAGGNILVGNDTTAVVLDASGDTKILVGNATTVTSVAVSADATLANTGALTLSSNVKGSHIVKFSGEVTWTGGGASIATAVAGVLATDIVQATIQTVPSEAGYMVSCAATTDTITTTLSAANTTNDAVIAYTVFRAVV